MRYQRISIDDYAMYQRFTGMNVENIAGVWWAEVRPFFFRPLIPFTEVPPAACEYPVKSFIGGCLHAIPQKSKGNSQMHLFVYDDVQNYVISHLKEKHRYITRKGIKNFTARQINDVQQFRGEAYDIYLSFYNRTGYEYQKKRQNNYGFREWSAKLFDNPGYLIMGAYREDKLSAISISYWVEDLIIDDVFFAATDSLNLKVTDFMLHTIRETAAATDACYIFRGLPTGQRSLDDSKVMRGCKILQKPALLRLNPIALYAAKFFMNTSYQKLNSITSLPIPETPEILIR